MNPIENEKRDEHKSYKRSTCHKKYYLCEKFHSFMKKCTFRGYATLLVVHNQSIFKPQLLKLLYPNVSEYHSIKQMTNYDEHPR